MDLLQPRASGCRKRGLNLQENKRLLYAAWRGTSLVTHIKPRNNSLQSKIIQDQKKNQKNWTVKAPICSNTRIYLFHAFWIFTTVLLTSASVAQIYLLSQNLEQMWSSFRWHNYKVLIWLDCWKHFSHIHNTEHKENSTAYSEYKTTVIITILPLSFCIWKMNLCIIEVWVAKRWKDVPFNWNLTIKA